ncbi:MAG: hypothetical protein SF162_10825 [bacterium]|nr:hypothetical protein [bacterium]
MARRIVFAFMLIALAGLIAVDGWTYPVVAQEAPPRPQPGDPPIASLITFSPPTADGLITITGAANALPPNGSVIIRNLYTEQTTIAPVGVTGGFRATIYGVGNTPFWISPVGQSIPPGQNIAPGSLPGGAGTILWSGFNASPDDAAADTSITRLRIDGDVRDWDSFGSAAVHPSVNALRSRESAWIAVRDARLTAGSTIRVQFIMNSTTYAVTFAPDDPSASAFERVNPNQAALDSLPITAITGEGAAELRIPLTFEDRVNSFNVTEVRFDDATAAAAVITINPTTDPTPFQDVPDGIFRPSSALTGDPIRFTVGGVLGNGAGFWMADGRSGTLRLQPGGAWAVEMDVTLTTPQLPPSATLYALVRFLPIGGTDAPANIAGGINGWSAELLHGLPVDDVTPPAAFDQVITVQRHQILYREGRAEFALDAAFTLPETLANGLYIPQIEGFVTTDERDPAAVLLDDGARWEASPLFGVGSGRSRQTFTRLPLVLNIGGVSETRLPTTILFDAPSDGSRGILAEGETFALSNRVKFNAPTYILPPGDDDGDPIAYSLEPYLLNVLPNAYQSSAAPLIPFDFSEAGGSELRVRVTKPDGDVDTFGAIPLRQNALSSPAVDERSRFGAQSPVDVYRVTTLDPRLARYAFDQYGAYTLTVELTLADVFGNRYSGGGEYALTVAEPLDMTPAVLPGTPFEVGNVYHPGITLLPGVNADVTLNVRIHPLDGSTPRERTLTGTANEYGVFMPRDPAIILDTPGLVIASYEARYRDRADRLWAASLRSASVIAAPDTALVAHGQRGIPFQPLPRLTWFRANNYAGTGVIPSLLYAPFFAGDVAWIGESAADGLFPLLRVQDTGGAYANRVIDAVYAEPAAESGQRLQRDFTAESGIDFPFAAASGELPVRGGYALLSAVRPGLALRQFITDGSFSDVPLWWDSDDPYNGQIGAGTTGDRPGDYTFVFGGALITENDAPPSGGTLTAAIYGSLAVVIDPNDPQGARLYPPLNGSAGGGNGGALVAIDDRAFEMFFVPSGTPPGALLRLGDSFTVAGQVAPTLPAQVDVTITAPSGAVRQFSGSANAIGYYYDPSRNFTVDEVGVWTVDLQVIGAARTSVGDAAPPYVTGGVLRPEGTRYQVYVLPETNAVLESSIQLPDVLIPTGVPYNFAFTIPGDWTNTQGYITLRTPSYLLRDDSAPVNGRSIAYQFAPAALRGSFPNIENEPRASGNAVVDPMILTVVATGQDAAGQFQIQARQFTFFYNRLMQLTDGDFAQP